MPMDVFIQSKTTILPAPPSKTNETKDNLWSIKHLKPSAYLSLNWDCNLVNHSSIQILKTHGCSTRDRGGYSKSINMNSTSTKSKSQFIVFFRYNQTCPSPCKSPSLAKAMIWLKLKTGVIWRHLTRHLMDSMLSSLAWGALTIFLRQRPYVSFPPGKGRLHSNFLSSQTTLNIIILKLNALSRITQRLHLIKCPRLLLCL